MEFSDFSVFLDSFDSGQALLLFALLLIIVGLATGFLAGLFGVGGGAVMVPLFEELLLALGADPDYAIKSAVATSLALILPIGLRSFYKHLRTGEVDTRLLMLWVAPVIVGVASGLPIVTYASGAVFRALLAGFFAVLAIKLMIGSRGNRKVYPFGTGLKLLYGYAMGLFSGLLGIGGGSLGSAVMLMHGYDIRRAVATASGLGPLIAFPALFVYFAAGRSLESDGTTGFWSLGYIDIAMFVLSLPSSWMMTAVGVRVAHAMDQKLLERCFAVFLFSMSLKFAYNLAVL